MVFFAYTREHPVVSETPGVLRTALSVSCLVLCTPATAVCLPSRMKPQVATACHLIRLLFNFFFLQCARRLKLMFRF